MIGYGLDPLIIDSNGKGGYHPRVFFKNTIDASVAWWLGRQVNAGLQAAGLPPIETFPKQGELTLDHPYGNWIRLPGRHHKRDHWSRIYVPDGEIWLTGDLAVKKLLAMAGDDTSKLLEAYKESEAKSTPPEASRNGRANHRAHTKKREEPDEATVRDALAYLPDSWTESYGGTRTDTGWLGTGMALHDWDSTRGLDLWKEFSGRSTKYEEGVCEAKWGSFTAGGGLTVGTIFHEALRNGWKPRQDRTDENPPVDADLLRDAATKFTLFSDLIGDSEFLDRLARLEVEDQGAGKMIRATLAETLGKKFKSRDFDVVMKAPRKAARPPRSQPSPETETTPRTEIIITHELHEMVAKAVAALACNPDIFQRFAALVRMVRNVKPPKGMRETEGTPQVVAIPTPRILELMSRDAIWLRESTDKDGDPVFTPAEPPGHVASMVGARGDWPNVRPLEGILEAPTIRPDGTILQNKGYDVDTGLFLLPEVEFPEIPEGPNRDDARQAVGEILDLVVDFPFVEDFHKYAWLASLLTVLCRNAIRGPSPFFLFDANTAGSGKTKLCDIVAMIATGRKMSRSDYSQDNDEMNKVLLSIALGGFPFVLFDNIETGDKIGGKALDRTIDSSTVGGRILGSTQFVSDIPFLAVLFGTGNNIGVKGDALRRIVPCRIEAKEERPEERGNWTIEGDLLDHVKENRGRLVKAAITIVRAYVVAGRPDQSLKERKFNNCPELDIRH